MRVKYKTTNGFLKSNLGNYEEVYDMKCERDGCNFATRQYRDPGAVPLIQMQMEEHIKAKHPNNPEN